MSKLFLLLLKKNSSLEGIDMSIPIHATRYIELQFKSIQVNLIQVKSNTN